ncbi:MAG: HAD hydrolase-like protein [Clostridia bacterium]|nr:HAD hydrolase-like protein [Clostridia bacterium]
MKFRAALFDLDGTLTDPAEGITNSVKYALKKFGVTVNDARSLYKFIGPPLAESFSEFYGFDKEKSLLAVKFFREYFAEKGIWENVKYDGADELLNELKNRRVLLALATSKPTVYAQKILTAFGLAKYFDAVVGSELDGRLTDKAEIIAAALKKLCVSHANAVMVGDRKHDVIGAKKNGVNSVGVLYGYGGKKELSDAGADFFADSPAQILDFI